MLSPEEIQQRKRDFIDTYRRPEPPEPFFGFFEVQEPEPDGYKYNQVQHYLDKGLTPEEIAVKMNTSTKAVKGRINYIKWKEKL